MRAQARMFFLDSFRLRTYKFPMLFSSPFQVFVAIEGIIDTVKFPTYQEASDFAHELVRDQPAGKLTVVGPHKTTKQPTAMWSYEREP